MSSDVRKRRKRGSLSQEEIVAAALTILDTEGEPALKFSRLGDELKSSPTAVYRHFASRYDLLIAVADHLDELSLDGYVPTDDWRADLEDLAWRAWQTTTAHPAAAAATFSLVTNGPNELRAVEWVLRAMHMAGLRGRAAVIQYQVFANLVLGSASAEGARLSASDPREKEDGWVQVYAPKHPEKFPYAEEAKAELALMNYEEVFAKQVEMYLDALEALAAKDRE